MSKKTVTISVDETLWNLAKDKLPTSRSEFFENQVKLYLDVDDPESKLIKKISKKKNELNALEEKLCNMRQQKAMELKMGAVFDAPMVPIMRLVDKLGFVGQNQIRNIAHNFDVPAEDLVRHVKSLGIEVRNYYESPK